jgi:hypothetical protein
MKSTFALLIVVLISAASASAKADPFDDFVGHYTPVAAPSIQNLRSPTCNKFDFAELSGFDVVADRTGLRQTHSLRIIVPNGYSVVPVVPEYKDPSELDPTVGVFGDSEGDGAKAMTISGNFGYDKNETLQLTLESIPHGARLSIANEMKSKDGTVLNGCYYTSDLVKSEPSAP